MSDPISTFHPDFGFNDAIALFDTADIAVLAVNSRMVVTFWNPAARRLLGWTTDDDLQHPLSELLHTTDIEMASAAIAMFSEDEPWSGVVPVLRNDGTAIEIRINCNPVHSGANGIVGGLAILAEIATDLTNGRVYHPFPPEQTSTRSVALTGVEPISVLVAADSLLVGQGLVSLLSEVPDFVVVGLAREQAELVTLCNDLRPQALIVNVRSPSAASAEMVDSVRQLRTDFPALGSVFISDCGNGFALELLRDGASRVAYLLGEALPTVERIVEGVRDVIAGQSVLDPSIVDLLVKYRSSFGVDDLTIRDIDVWELISQGCSNRSIAEQLSISVKSIEKSVTSIFRSLEVSDSSSVDRRVTAALSYQRARITGLETQLRRIQKEKSAAYPVPTLVTPGSDDHLDALG
jgi:PAS domain S-box-containing protein